MIDTVILAFGLVLIIEGLAPALFPNKWKKYLLTIAEQSTQNIRNIGLFLCIFGAMIILITNM